MALRHVGLFARNIHRTPKLFYQTSYVCLTIELKRMYYTEPSVISLQHVQSTAAGLLDETITVLGMNLRHSQRSETVLLPRCCSSNKSLHFYIGISHIRNSHLDAGVGNGSLVECSCSSTRSLVHTGDFQIIENFITTQEQNILLKEIESHFKGARYEYDHWDDAIHGYRETEKSKWSEETQGILQRVRDQVFSPDAMQLPLVHVLDLAEDGYIKPHIDSVKFCGPTIAGLSLISPSVVKLVNEKDDTQWLKALLPAQSLYVMRNKIRYDYTHEILKDEDSIISGGRIKRGRRVSVMFRDHPVETDDLQ